MNDNHGSLDILVCWFSLSISAQYYYESSITYFAFISCQFDPAKLRKLRPSFKENGGSVTAGNASSIR